MFALRVSVCMSAVLCFIAVSCLHSRLVSDFCVLFVCCLFLLRLMHSLALLFFQIAENFAKYAHNERLRSRFIERMDEYRTFWVMMHQLGRGLVASAVAYQSTFINLQDK